MIRTGICRLPAGEGPTVSNTSSLHWLLALFKVNPKKLETGLETISAGIPYTLLLRILGFQPLGLFYCSRKLATTALQRLHNHQQGSDEALRTPRTCYASFPN